MPVPPDLVTAGLEIVRPHLAPGESVVHATAAVVGRKVPRRLSFLGLAPRGQQPVVLTSHRLLVLRPGKPGREDWLDLQLDRSRLAAEPPGEVGGHPVVQLTSGVGPLVVVFPKDGAADAARLVEQTRSRA